MWAVAPFQHRTPFRVFSTKHVVRAIAVANAIYAKASSRVDAVMVFHRDDASECVEFSTAAHARFRRDDKSSNVWAAKNDRDTIPIPGDDVVKCCPGCGVRIANAEPDAVAVGGAA